MKTRFLHFMTPLVAIWLSACSGHVSNGKQEVFNLDQLVGRWEHVEAKNNQVEQWMRAGSNELQGKGFVMEKGDTTFIEFLKITQSNGTLIYSAQVGDQNNGDAVRFALVNQTAKTIEFANYSHDFPQRIVYEIKSDSTMQAYIEGPRNGQKIRIVFDFIKRN